MEQFYRENRTKGLEVLGICTSDGEDATREVIEEMHLTFKMAHDVGQRLSTQLNVTGEPVLILLDKDLKVIHIANDIYPKDLKIALAGIGIGN